MTMPPSTPPFRDQNSKIQRQLVLFLPLISLAYGGFLPAGLFIYWIVTTVFAIVQQYLIVGWGSMFPLFGWTRPASPVITARGSRWRNPSPERDAGTKPSRQLARPPTDRTPTPALHPRPPPCGPRTRPSGPTRETTLT